jgi:hypothetical protein
MRVKNEKLKMREGELFAHFLLRKKPGFPLQSFCLRQKGFPLQSLAPNGLAGIKNQESGVRNFKNGVWRFDDGCAE